jgi:hypothetical protein
MENSISLGLLHGLVYGIVPAAPWFVALKRYLLEGKERGQLAFSINVFWMESSTLDLVLF